MKKETRLTLAIILGVLVLAGLILYLKKPAPPDIMEELAKCIGQNSVVYTQTGCIHCIEQEEMFGDYVRYLTIVDCLKDNNIQRCISAGIEGTPTWIIKNQTYPNVRTIEELKELTGC